MSYRSFTDREEIAAWAAEQAEWLERRAAAEEQIARDVPTVEIPREEIERMRAQLLADSGIFPTAGADAPTAVAPRVCVGPRASDRH